VMEQKNKIDFSAGISALTLLRFLADNAASMPVSVLSRTRENKRKVYSYLLEEGVIVVKREFTLADH